MKRFAWTRPEGGVAVTYVDDRDRRPGEDADALADRILREHGLPAGLAGAVALGPEDELPPRDEFRPAWVIQDGAVRVDMERAREIHRDRIREARAPLLAELDIAFQRALEDGSDTASIVAEKQRLRDAPADPRIDAARTPEELKAVWPL